MSKRSAAQRTGKSGERIVEALVGNHPRWVARRQDEDFGIDLEAELADETEDGQQLTGRLVKIQVKTRERYPRRDGRVPVSIERRWLDYACGFRVPIILVAVSRKTGESWWIWLQEWALLHEEMLAVSTGRTVTVKIPLEQRLADGLGHALPAIAEGTPANAMVLALRGVLEVAHGWENQTIARGVVELLGRTEFPSRDWTIGKVADRLAGFGPGVPFWKAQEMLPILLALIETGGDAITRDQIVRLVARGDTYSRVGLAGLAQLYDRWPDHAAGLGLPAAFDQIGLDAVAWYAAMRERFPGNIPFGMCAGNLKDADLRHGGLELRLDEDLRYYLMSKWPNRGDSVLLDCLTATPE